MGISNGSFSTDLFRNTLYRKCMKFATPKKGGGGGGG